MEHNHPNYCYILYLVVFVSGSLSHARGLSVACLPLQSAVACNLETVS